MPLPNRVVPDGSLHEHPARGMFTGNRGIVHDRSLTGEGLGCDLETFLHRLHLAHKTNR